VNRSWVIALLLAACVDSRDPPNRFVGTLESSNTLVFVVRDPTLTSAYAVDGTVVPIVFEWFSANSADTISLPADSGATTLDIDFTARTGTLGSEAVTFEPLDDPRFGLYRGSKTVDDRTYEAGIIVADDRVQNGAIEITSTMTTDITTIVSPRIVPGQTRVTLLNDVAIELAVTSNAFVR
jgi:hypothetical protein